MYVLNFLLNETILFVSLIQCPRRVETNLHVVVLSVSVSRVFNNHSFLIYIQNWFSYPFRPGPKVGPFSRHI